MVMNAKLLTNYAAYCAARAGIVHNGNINQMQNAAAVALSPLFTYSSSLGGLATGYGRALANARSGQLIRVDILSPSASRFSSMDKRFFPTLRSRFNTNDLNETVLQVRVTFRYPLEIPLINRIMSPFFTRVTIRSTYQMRMQSDAMVN